MNTKTFVLVMLILSVCTVNARDDSNNTVGFSSENSVTSLIFDGRQKTDLNTFIGIKGEVPLNANANTIALDKFKERMGQKPRSFIELYGQIEMGYTHTHKSN